jgi:hypothetical protein
MVHSPFGLRSTEQIPTSDDLAQRGRQSIQVGAHQLAYLQFALPEASS